MNKKDVTSLNDDDSAQKSLAVMVVVAAAAVHIQMLFLPFLQRFFPSCEHSDGRLRLEKCRTFLNRIDKETLLLCYCLLLRWSEKPFLQIPCL